MGEPFRHSLYTPYWWEAAPRPAPAAGPPPASADVVVIGTGFTGLNAALTLSRAGRSVAALDGADIGYGASTRNGGQIGPGNQMFAVRELVERFGREKALRVYREGQDMLAYFKDLIRSEGIDCDLNVCGRFRGAITTKHYDAMAKELETSKDFAGVEGFVVAKPDVPGEIRSDEYVGGVVLSEDGAVHPGRFHDGLAARARQAGAVLLGDMRVLGFSRDRGGFTVDTPAGPISARDVVVATNGYTGTLSPFFQKRITPVGSGIIATEPIGSERVAALLPSGRVYGESRRVFNYFRASPDGTRLLFGGRCERPHGQTPGPYTGLYQSMVRIFPELAGVRVSHAWSGYVGISQDRFPHIGVEDGVHYAMGYSGTGVTRATYFGHKLALRVLGDAGGATAFDDLEFRRHRVLARVPAVVNAYVQWMRFLDMIEGSRLTKDRS